MSTKTRINPRPQLIPEPSPTAIRRPKPGVVLSRQEGSKRSNFVSQFPFDENRVGAAAVYCSDGRYGEQMDEFLHTSLGLPRYDRLALPGGAGCLAGHLMTAYNEKIALERQLEFLIKAHDLKRIVLIAHQGCGFYKDLWTDGRTIEAQQREDLAKAAEQLRNANHGFLVETYFARRVDGQVAFECWDVQPVAAARV
jgi:carbonic anhydrase-like protein